MLSVSSSVLWVTHCTVWIKALCVCSCEKQKLLQKKEIKIVKAETSVIRLEWAGEGWFLLTCAPSAQEGQQGHLSWSRGVNSEETSHHLSGPIDFHMKSKYIHSVCAALQLCLPVGQTEFKFTFRHHVPLIILIYDWISSMMSPFCGVSLA